MQQLDIRFIKSAVLIKDFPPADRPEVAITGRSNAGKSSFLNALSRQKVAHISNTPGKTRLLNFFEAGKHYRLVDMPGYGYASRSGKEMLEWQEMVEAYLSERESIVGLILIMDIRRDWDEHEQALKEFANLRGWPLAVLLNKCDKLRPHEVVVRKRRIQMQSNVSQIFCVSAVKKEGFSEVEEFIFKDWVKPALEESSHI